MSNLALASDQLTEGEAAQVATLSGAPRAAVWGTTRRALRRALDGAGLPTDTSSHHFPSRTASLSHSGDLGVAAVRLAAPDAAWDRVVGIGVDVELDRMPDPRTASFFLTERERAWLDTVSAADTPPAMLRLWTVKEALFKADPANAGTILRDYAVADPPGWRGRAARVDAGGLEFQYVSLALPRGVLSVALALSRSRKVNPVQAVDFDQVAERISTLISVPLERLTPEATFAELVPDSFMFVEVSVDLQEEFEVVLSQHDLKDVHTLGDLATLLRIRQAEQAADG